MILIIELVSFTKISLLIVVFGVVKLHKIK